MLLSDLIPDPAAVLILEPEELAGILVVLLNGRPGEERVKGFTRYTETRALVRGYGHHTRELEEAISEAWSAMESLGLIAEKSGDVNGTWQVVTRRGASITSEGEFKSFRVARMYPRETLHPLIADSVYPLFLRGDYDTSVFQAFKNVEVAVRTACGNHAASNDIGVNLMRKAFHAENGPLTNLDEHFGEREALLHLFSGAMARFKNPASHRHVPLTNPAEAIEILQFASHLLRVVDDRRVSAP